MTTFLIIAGATVAWFGLAALGRWVSPRITRAMRRRGSR